MSDYKVRVLILSEDVNQDSAKNIIDKIITWNEEDNQDEKKIMDFVRKPIILHINTWGGSAYDCMAIINTIRTSKTPVHGYCYGKAMSAGIFIFASCHHRIATESTTFFYHGMRSGPYGTNLYLKTEVEENERLMEMLDKILTGSTKIKQKKLDEVKAKSNDNWYISGDEALSLGLVDELV